MQSISQIARNRLIIINIFLNFCVVFGYKDYTQLGYYIENNNLNFTSRTCRTHSAETSQISNFI